MATARLRPVLEDVRARARAAFLGLAVGDALGATVEFMLPGEIRALHGVHREITGGGWLRLRPGQVTDDTQMSVWMGRAIVNGGSWDVGRIAVHLAAWLRTGPMDVGNTVRRGLRRFVADRSLAGPPNPGDAGNGAAMRMVPPALVSLADHDLLGRRAVAQARITHNHPLSDAACVHVGELVQMACLGLGMNRMRRATDALLVTYPDFAFSPYRGESGGYVAETLATVAHFLYSTSSFDDCLVGVVNQGGDADTTGAIAGAIAGAYYGVEGMPRRWLKALDPEVRDEVEFLAERLVDLSPLAAGEPPDLGPGHG